MASGAPLADTAFIRIISKFGNDISPGESRLRRLAIPLYFRRNGRFLSSFI
jgi:hypothetical protein